MPLQLITPPAAEPIDLIEAKLHLRVTDSSEDALVSGLIASGRRQAETRAQTQIIAARWKLVLDSFPGPQLGVAGVPFGRAYGLPPHAILIPKAAVLQIASIGYTAMDGSAQTMVAGTDYVVDISSAPARITPPFGKIWPIPLPQIGAVQVTFDAGMAAKLTVDASADWIYVPGWKTLAVNDPVRFSNSGGNLPGGLVAQTDYFVRSVVSADKYTLSATSGGALLDITATAGVGTSYIGFVEPDLMAWMRLAMGTLYENREAVSVDMRITAVELPTEFLDGLLDTSRLVLY